MSDRGIQDMNQAVAVLDALQHWKLQCENSAVRGRYYSCAIRDSGCRVTAAARTPLMAVQAALVKLREHRRQTRKPKKHSLSVVGGSPTCD